MITCSLTMVVLVTNSTKLNKLFTWMNEDHNQNLSKITVVPFDKNKHIIDLKSTLHISTNRTSWFGGVFKSFNYLKSQGIILKAEGNSGGCLVIT